MDTKITLRHVYREGRGVVLKILEVWSEEWSVMCSAQKQKVAYHLRDEL